MSPGKTVAALTCQCTECVCQEGSIGDPLLDTDLCVCCVSDCPDVHPWNNLGGLFEGKTLITPANQWRLGRIRRGGR